MDEGRGRAGGKVVGEGNPAGDVLGGEEGGEEMGDPVFMFGDLSPPFLKISPLCSIWSVGL